MAYYLQQGVAWPGYVVHQEVRLWQRYLQLLLWLTQKALLLGLRPVIVVAIAAIALLRGLFVVILKLLDLKTYCCDHLS